MNRVLRLTALLLLLQAQHLVYAWDSVGHRLTAAVALEFVSVNKRAMLLDILAQHPRYQEDFLQEMPAFIRTDQTLQAQWLLGQAAYWPDIVRGLPAAERNRYHRGPWHYTDGAWVRDSAPFQGNSYVGIDAFANIDGEPANSIRREDQVHNVVTALDYNTRVLADTARPGAERAVALCWVLHLMGDIHQPLHTGSLFSEYVFDDGDAGGNGVTTDGDSNLHARWDGALRDEGVTESLPVILEQIGGFSRPRIQGVESDWTSWMNESRQLLHSIVYTDSMKTEIAAADQARREPRASTLSENYVEQMKRYSRQRIGLAGLRFAIWFENEIP